MPVVAFNLSRSAVVQQRPAFAPITNKNTSNLKSRSVSWSRQPVVCSSASSDNAARQAISGVVSSIYKLSAGFQSVDASLPAIWQGIKRLDKSAVQDALRKGADPNTPDPAGNTPLLFIAREGHYKYPPVEIPTLLIQSGADMEAKDTSGKTALQISLLSGWQNIAELLIKNGANTSGVASIKSQITCPDCKRIVATYNL